jgi:hypothetical protein
MLTGPRSSVHFYGSARVTPSVDAGGLKSSSEKRGKMRASGAGGRCPKELYGRRPLWRRRQSAMRICASRSRVEDLAVEQFVA